MLENIKVNPRIIVHGVPTEMPPEEIKTEIIAQNLDDAADQDLKVTNLYKPRNNRRVTSCVLEVSPIIRRVLLKNGIYLHYITCTFADHVRILQCYRCLAFGHMAKECKAAPMCGHYSGTHEMKDCMKKMDPPRCGNYLHTSSSSSDLIHSATDLCYRKLI